MYLNNLIGVLQSLFCFRNGQRQKNWSYKNSRLIGNFPHASEKLCVCPWNTVRCDTNDANVETNGKRAELSSPKSIVDFNGFWLIFALPFRLSHFFFAFSLFILIWFCRLFRDARVCAALILTLNTLEFRSSVHICCVHLILCVASTLNHVALHRLFRCALASFQ